MEGAVRRCRGGVQRLQASCMYKLGALWGALRYWIHRLWLVPFADGVPDPFLHGLR